MLLEHRKKNRSLLKWQHQDLNSDKSNIEATGAPNLSKLLLELQKLPVPARFRTDKNQLYHPMVV